MASHRAATVARLSAAPDLLPGDEMHLGFYGSSFAAEGLKAYADAIPPEDQLEQPVETQDNRSSLRRQAQLTVLAFKTGVAVSADLWLGGFDTQHEPRPASRMAVPQPHRCGGLPGWDYAEEHGVANRMVVVIGSDFGRTNFYNSVNGKDHWPIGSYVVMEKNRSWTGRAVGETDGLHFAYKIDPLIDAASATTLTARSSTRSTCTRRCAATSASSTRPAPCASPSTIRRISLSFLNRSYRSRQWIQEPVAALWTEARGYRLLCSPCQQAFE